MLAMVDEPDMVKSPVPEGTYENISSEVFELLHYEIMFTLEQRRQGGVVVHFLVCLYAFAALAILCDDYFCASLNKICKRLDIHPDVAGATFMAAGSSMPTMFISVTSVFLDEGDIGLGTIIGSTMFNILFITGICGIAAKQVINLKPYSILRDSLFYFIYLIILLITMYDGMIQWYEAAVVSLVYGFYILVMYYNTSLEHHFNVWARAHFHQTRHVFDSPVKSPFKTALSPAVKPPPTSPSKQATKSPSNSPTKSPPKSPTNSPTKSPTNSPSNSPTKSPSNSTTKSPPNSPTKSPPKSPTNPPSNSPTKSPPNSPTKSPSKSPMNSPSKSPVNTPSPINQPTNPPTQSPTTTEDLELSEDQPIGPTTSTPIKKPSEVIEIENDCILTQEHEELSDIRSVFSEEDSTIPHTKYDEQPEDALSCPLGGWARLRWTIMFPIRLLYYFTIPDCRLKDWENWYVITFVTSIMWMGAHSYVLVWAVSVIGATIGLPECIMGLTLLAVGSSVPDAIASLVMTRQNMGDMALANAIGSNIFDMLCLSIPWLFSTTIVHPNSVVMINGGNILYVSLTLFGTVITTLIILYNNKWRLDRKLGCAMLTTYVFFLSTAVIIESQPRDKKVKPLHRPDLPHQGLGIPHHQKHNVKNTGFTWH